MLSVAEDLAAEVRGLDDSTLRRLRGWLAMGEVSGWVADKIHGVCIVEGCERFCAEEVIQ